MDMSRDRRRTTRKHDQDADTDVRRLMDDFEPAPTESDGFGRDDTGAAGRRRAPAPPVHDVADDHRPTDSFDRIETSTEVDASRVPGPTRDSPVLCELTYERRMEANLYVTRTMMAEDHCRITIDGEALTIAREDGFIIARNAQGRIVAAHREVPLLLLEILKQTGA